MFANPSENYKTLHYLNQSILNLRADFTAKLSADATQVFQQQLTLVEVLTTSLEQSGYEKFADETLLFYNVPKPKMV